MGFLDEAQAAAKPFGHKLALDDWLEGRDDADEIREALHDPSLTHAQLFRALQGRGYKRSEASVYNWRQVNGVR